MKLISDTTNRFLLRPYYETHELERESELVLSKFSEIDTNGGTFPILTDTIIKTVEREVADLDLYADLSDEGPNVEGETLFFPGKKSRVRISKALSARRSENRLRTTVTHEYAHVILHSPLFSTLVKSYGSYSAGLSLAKCSRDDLIEPEKVDWMEWQASYLGGAILMPITEFVRFINEIEEAIAKSNYSYSPERYTNIIVNSIADHFGVSKEAASVRLSQVDLRF